MPSPLSLVSVCAALLTAQPGPAAERPCCRVLELRQYTLKPGGRDVLIDLFEREFIESQEALGVRLVGQFQDTHAAERFVWVRGFPDMDTRAKALAAFYGGPVHAQLSRSPPWTQRVLPALRRQLKAAPQVLELQPTPRSQLR